MNLKKLISPLLASGTVMLLVKLYAKKKAYQEVEHLLQKNVYQPIQQEDLESFLIDRHQTCTLVMLPSYLEDDDQEAYQQYFEHLGSFNQFVFPKGYLILPETLVAVERFLISHYGKWQKIIIYGKGLGANMMLNSASLYTLNHVDALISDGACTSLHALLKEDVKRRHPFLTPWILSEMVALLKQRHHIDVSDFDTCAYLHHNKIPVCFIHSQYDEHVSLRMVYPLYNACTSPKELFILKEEEKLYEIHQEDDYHLTLKAFIQRYITKEEERCI